MYEQIKQKVKAVSDSFLKIKEKAVYFAQNLDAFEIEFLFSPKKREIENKELSFSVGAVDSGFFSDSFIGFDFCLVKVSGSVFKYEKNKLVESKRYPLNIKPIFITPDAYLQSDEFDKFVSISRLKQELLLAKEIIEQNDLNYFLLDGSLIPHPQDKLKKESLIYDEYLGLIKCFVDLYAIAEKKNTKLAGCIEDSRSNMITKQLNIDKVNDLILLNYALKKKEAINFFNSGKNNKMLDDINNFKQVELFSCFLKINDYDLPLKIEMLSPDEDIIDIIYFLSSHTKNYSYPSVIIDADLRAKLCFSEVNTIKNYIESITNKEGIRKLRRNRRPF